MHPLLSPTTHTDLRILAQQLVAAKYCDSSSVDDTYLKLFLGITLGLTALEAVQGVTLSGKQVILKTPLVERVIRRTTAYGFTVKATDTSVQVNYTISGRKVGDVTLDQAEFNPPVSREVLYDLALIKGARLYFPDLFGHKFTTELELSLQPAPESTPTNVSQRVEAVKQTVPGLTTADQLPVKPTTTGKLALAENSQRLIDWQNAVMGLSSDFPDDWDGHAQKLKDLKFLPEDEFNSIWAKYKAYARDHKGIGYNSVTRKFYQLNYTPHVAATVS